jgi:hypothetical protein
MNWLPPVVRTAVVLLVEPDHLLVRDVRGGAVLLPGGPVLDGLTPVQTAQATLRGPGSGQLTLWPMLVDERQLYLIDTPDGTAAGQVVTDLHRPAMTATDGYAAREALSRPLLSRLASEQAANNSSRLVSAWKLQSGAVPPGL